ncbi:hypothetical protein GCM10009602_10190 [Nocardiopsis tropica]
MCGEHGPERLQHLLNFYAWDTDGVRDDLRALVVDALGDADHGVLILDDTGFHKGHEVGRGRPPVLRYCREDRELPDRCVPGLRQSDGAGADRPGTLPAQSLDRGP